MATSEKGQWHRDNTTLSRRSLGEGGTIRIPAFAKAMARQRKGEKCMGVLVLKTKATILRPVAMRDVC